MRLILFTILTMSAFAANSVLNRLALAPGDMDAVLFGSIRVASGAMALVAIMAFQGKSFAFGGSARFWAVLTLLIYIFGFSAAYGALDPGFGALILFAVVQVTMFAGAVLAREPVPVTRWLGAGLALSGLGWLLWPSEAGPVSVTHALAMAAAGVGWGIYSLLGRGARDPLQATAMNFLLASPVAVVIWVTNGSWNAPVAGVLLAVLSGVVTSGLGYALWYRILPELGASRAAVAQLSVPVIALVGGMVFLGELLTLKFGLAAGLVMVGVAVSLRKG